MFTMVPDLCSRMIGSTAVLGGRRNQNRAVFAPAGLGAVGSAIDDDGVVAVGQLKAVVFDLLYTLVHPGEFPGGGDRTTWLAGLLGIDERELESRWDAFELDLESGRAQAVPPLGPELTWLTQVAAELGSSIEPEVLALVGRDWDLTRRLALLDPPVETLEVLGSLRSNGIKIGVLSNTHALELRVWSESPLADLVDAVALSHAIGVMKPQPAAYAVILDRLGVEAGAAAYVGDGSSDELLGARRAGFATVVLAAEAPMRLAPARLPVLEAQADIALRTLLELPVALRIGSRNRLGGLGVAHVGGSSRYWPQGGRRVWPI